MHLCTELTAAFWTLEPFGKNGANFSLQLSSRTRFDKINKKKVIAKNQCEKQKKSSLTKCLKRLICPQHISIMKILAAITIIETNAASIIFLFLSKLYQNKLLKYKKQAIFLTEPWHINL